MSKYKFDVSLVISGLSEGVFELQPSDYLYCEDELFVLVIANIVGNSSNRFGQSHELYLPKSLESEVHDKWDNCYHQGKYYIAGNTFKINFYEED